MKTELFKNALQTWGRTSFDPKKFENAGFSCGRKTFWKRRFSMTMVSRQSWYFPSWVLLKHYSKITSDCIGLKKFFGVVWTENVWCVFRVRPFSNSAGEVWTGRTELWRSLVIDWRVISIWLSIGSPLFFLADRAEKPALMTNNQVYPVYLTCTREETENSAPLHKDQFFVCGPQNSYLRIF